jgi:hypothetical protein
LESPVKPGFLWRSNPRVNNNNNIIIVTKGIFSPSFIRPNNWDIFYEYKEINSKHPTGLVFGKEYSRPLDSFMNLFVPDNTSEYIL